MNFLRYTLVFTVVLCGCGSKTPTPSVAPKNVQNQASTSPAELNSVAIDTAATYALETAIKEKTIQKTAFTEAQKQVHVKSTTNEEFQELLDAEEAEIIKLICQTENKTTNQVTYQDILGHWKFNLASATAHYARARKISTNQLSKNEVHEFHRLLHQTTLNTAWSTRTLPTQIPKEKIEEIGILTGKKLAEHYANLKP